MRVYFLKEFIISIFTFRLKYSIGPRFFQKSQICPKILFSLNEIHILLNV